MAPPVNRKRRLSAEVIVEAAFALAEQEGPRGLTIRRLGQALGADATALYRHFGTKDDLLISMVDTLVGRVLSDMPREGTWQELLADGARRTVAMFERYPAVGIAVSEVLTRRDSRPANVEPLLASLARAGLSPDDALVAYRAYVDFLMAYASFRARTTLITPEQKQRDRTAWAARVRDTEQPTVAELGAGLFDVSDDAVLEHWLAGFVAGVERTAAARAV